MRHSLIVVALFIPLVLCIGCKSKTENPVEPKNSVAWTKVTSNEVYVTVFTVIGSTIFAGTNGVGVLVSTNNGTTWTAANGSPTQISCSAVIGTNLFVGTEGSGVFLSTNNGSSWTQINNGLSNIFVNTLAVSGTNLFAGTYGGLFGTVGG